MLRALSNAADPLALDAITPFVDDADPVVRLGAVEALEPLTDSKVDTLLARRLGAEERTNVRNAIVGAISARAPTEVSRQAALSLAQSDKDASVRSAAVALLGRFRDHYPDLDVVLRRLEQDDPEEKVRAAATEALDGK